MVTITKIRAGTTNNVIPEHVNLVGTLRAVSDATRTRALVGIERVATGIAAAHDMRAEVTVTPGYPPTVNHPEPVALLARVVRETLGERRYVEMPAPLMGAEDFSYVLQQCPGAIAFLGVCPPGVDAATAPACHSNRMMIDEAAMAAGVATYAGLAHAGLAGIA